MFQLRVLFSILFLFSLACMIKGLRFKRKNPGYVVVAGVISVCDLLCIAIVGAQNAKEAAVVLLPYYILHSWLLFAFLIMVVQIDRFRRFTPVLIVSAALCAYQTYLVVRQYMGGRIFSFQESIVFRKAWMVAADSENTGLLNSFRSYRLADYINIAIILGVLAACIVLSRKVFRTRYASLIILICLYCAGEFLVYFYSAPVWLPGIFHNLISIVCLHFVYVYAQKRLREWSLDRFANDMSDGFILYDRYDDLIHVNDMVKNTLREKLVEEFKDRKKLDEWVSGVSEVAGNEVIIYEGAEHTHYFSTAVRELGSSESPIGTLYILHDYTDAIIRMKAMEEASSELERANRMKSDFLANMSHEIRTPMNAVLGMAEIAMQEDDPDRRLDCLLQIQSSGNSLLAILNDILDYSRIESGKMEILEDEYEPFAELTDVANALASRIEGKPLELFFVVQSALPHRLVGDAMRIKQVMLNLAGNAIKFTHEGLVRVYIGYEQMGDDSVVMTCHVIDTGIGIRDEDIEKLFASFRQVDSSRNRAVEGTGLGLVISQKLVEAMGGSIGVESEYGKGSDFWFSIPQKVVDHTNDLYVGDADKKCACVFDNKVGMIGRFIGEMEHLGVEGRAIHSLSDYAPSGKKDFLFFREEDYDDAMKAFLDMYSDVLGIMMVRFDSDFESDRDNLHILRRPETTMTMVQMLNGKFEEKSRDENDKVFRLDFTAPDTRILVVDDNAINLTIAGGLLAPLGGRVDTADSGQAAINKVMANDYDIVFMDHMMPDLDGVEATRIIRAADLRQPVIIALSANAMEEAKHLFKEVGMEDFVAKPIDVRILMSTVKKWLPPEKIVAKDVDEESAPSAGSEVRVAIEELDIEGAVHALGSAALYDTIAEEYYRSGADKLDAIMNAFNSGDWTDYTIRVHALKSSSRQIGALALGDMAEALEKAGKAGDINTIKADTDEAMAEYQRLLDRLAEYYPEAEDESNSADRPLIDRPALVSLMDELEAYCNDLDMDGMEDIGKRLKEYSYEDAMGEQIALLHRGIRDLDTESCIEIADRLRQDA